VKVGINLQKNWKRFHRSGVDRKGSALIVVHAKKRGIFTAFNRDETRPQTHSSPH
jgi:hypothetical protein